MCAFAVSSSTYSALRGWGSQYQGKRSWTIPLSKAGETLQQSSRRGTLEDTVWVPRDASQSTKGRQLEKLLATDQMWALYHWVAIFKQRTCLFVSFQMSTQRSRCLAQLFGNVFKVCLPPPQCYIATVSSCQDLMALLDLPLLLSHIPQRNVARVGNSLE